MAATRSNFNLKGVKKSIASASDRTNSGFWWLTRKIYPWISTKTYPRISTKILPQNFSKNLLEDFPKNLPEDFSKNLLEDFSKNLPEDFSNRWCYPLLTCALSRASFPRTGTNIKNHQDYILVENKQKQRSNFKGSEESKTSNISGVDFERLD